MKKLCILGILAIITSLFSGCEDTNDNLVGDRGVGVVPVISNISPGFFTTDLENSYIAFSVDLSDNETVDSAKIQVVYNDKTIDFEKIESFPANIVISASELLNSLGLSESDVSLGDTFTVYVMTSSQGVTTRSTAALVVNVTCEFDPELTTGSYKLVSSSWESSGNVTLTADPDDPYTLYIDGIAEIDGLTSNGNKMKITIDPNTFEVSGDKVVLAANCSGWGSDYASYTNYGYSVSSGSFSSCDGSFDITFTISIDQGSWGSFEFTFTRNE